MKGCFILSAANGGVSENSTDPLPSSIPDGKLQEIGMIHPPFPPLHQLTYNFLLLPESPDKIRECITLWQANSRQLAAWIAQAKVQSARLPSCTWKWPVCPIISYSTSAPPDPPRDSPCLGTKIKDELSSELDSSLSSDPGALFQESPELPSKFGTLSSTSSFHSTNLTAPGRVAQAFHTQVGRNPLKRVRDASPSDSLLDENGAHKKQLVFWRPTEGRLEEMQTALACGEVASHYVGCNPGPSTRVRDPRCFGTRETIGVRNAHAITKEFLP